MKFFSLVPAMLMLVILAACSSGKKKDPAIKDQISQMKLNKENVKNFVSDWPEASRRAAEEMLQKHGDPSEVSSSMIVWEKSQPFKRSIVYRDGVPHLFPVQHTEVLEQFVDYQVPGSKVRDLWYFNGSVKVDRTKGELSARSHKEELNILTLNLVNEIILGRLTPAQARRELTTYAASLEQGNINQYMTNLHFMQMENTGDPDKGILAPKLEKQAEEEKQRQDQ